MPMIVAHNLSALSTIQSLNTNNRSMSCSLSRLSTGYKINTGADDPAGLVISEQLRAQNVGLQRAVQNTQEANNMLGIAEGALSEMSNILNKMKQLAVHSANNGVTSPEQVAADQAEVDSSVQTIDRIARTTKFSDQFLLNGNKAIEFDSHTSIKSTSNFPLLDSEMSEIYQVLSLRQRMTIGFSGKDETGNADLTNEAKKAYFELDAADNRLDITTNSEGIDVLSKNQSFSLRGEKGSRDFTFAAGTTLGEINSTLNSASDSVGIESSLIFDSSQTVDMIAYTTTPVNTNLGVQTDGNAGNIPIFTATQGVQGMPASTVYAAGDQVTGFTVTATDVGQDQVRFDMIDSLGTIIGSQTQTLASTGPAGNDAQAITMTSTNGTQVSFNYNYGHSGPQAGTLTDNHVQTAGAGGSIPSFNAVQGVQNMSALTIDPLDNAGNTWTITQSTLDANTVRFTLTDGVTTTTQDITRSFAGGIKTDSTNVVLLTGNGSTCNFDYFFEEDNNKGVWDHIADGKIVDFDNSGNIVVPSLNTANTNGPGAANVTAPTNPTVDSAQNITSAISILDSNSADTSYNISAAAGGGGNQVIFTITGNSTGVVSTQTVNLSNLGTAGTGSQAISLSTPDGSTVDFDYYYDNDPSTSTFDRPTGSLFDLGFSQLPYDRPDGTIFTFNATNGATTNSNVPTDGTYAPVTGSITGLDAFASLDNDDQIGNSWTVSSSVVDFNTTRFTLVDNTGTRSSTVDVDMSQLPDIGIGTETITLTTGNGTSISFDWGYENDPNKNGGNGLFDSLQNATLATFNYAGNQTYVNPNSTNGQNVLNVTSPSAPVNAVQNIASQVNIFDVVNGETPMTISAADGATADEIIFTISGSTTDPLVTQAVSLASFSQAATGSQAISLTTPNGTLLEFDYFYENDPTTGEYDKPIGDLYTVDATPVNSERMFNGLSKAAQTAGAVIDVNLDPTTGTHVQNLEYGRNTDGQGRMFIKVVEHDLATQHIEFEVYKDSGFTPSGLIGFGSGSSDGTTALNILALNNSNLEGQITFDDVGGTIDFTDQANLAKDTYVGIGGIWGANGVDYEGGFALAAAAGAGEFAIEETVFSGIELGKNTDELGKIYYKTVQDGANSGQVFAYSNQKMRDEDIVAMSYAGTDLSADTEVVLNSVNDSGLGVILRTGATDWDGGSGSIINATTRFENLGVRVSTAEYGSSQELSITQREGQCWEYYSDPADSTATIVEADSHTKTLKGADAIININGTEKTCDGLTLQLATLELSGELVFNEGKVGATTVAQVGYDTGSVFTNAAFLTDTADGWTDSNGDGHRDPDEIDTFKAGANLVNAGHATTQTLDGFTGGMQLQLGEGAGGQERTVLGLRSMTALDLGRIREDNGKITCLNDMLSGGLASLAEDPVKALEVIQQAIDDVSTTRAQIGAWQSNLLETNANSLTVAIENITKSESYIRDADMAYESTQFSKNQILVQASTSMLAQSNQLSQGVLSLIG